MITRTELIHWCFTLEPGTQVAVDGLTLVALEEDGKPTGAYLEVGGTPEATQEPH